MTDLPDLTGYLMEDAEEILKNAGVRYAFTETSSPRNDVDGDEKRVVRQVISGDVVNVTLCRY